MAPTSHGCCGVERKTLLNGELGTHQTILIPAGPREDWRRLGATDKEERAVRHPSSRTLTNPSVSPQPIFATTMRTLWGQALLLCRSLCLAWQAWGRLSMLAEGYRARCPVLEVSGGGHQAARPHLALCVMLAGLTQDRDGLGVGRGSPEVVPPSGTPGGKWTAAAHGGSHIWDTWGLLSVTLGKGGQLMPKAT